MASVSEYSVRIIRITNVSDRDSVDRLLRPDYFHGRSSQNFSDQSTSELIDDHYVTSDPFELITRFLDRHQENNYLEEKEEDSILGYFKTRTHCVVALEDRVNNPTKSDEEICAICQVEFEHEETIETLGISSSSSTVTTSFPVINISKGINVHLGSRQ
ncbi:hypothetical protein HAX54_008049 [Datura stramonium]|uniref:Uncharacterized protein n=1 Tax=Datura stramonium TaxID=4076 RepID=A0ABS8TE79_DATST|nr:hypothetical protein [Datura stramonium]